MTRTPAARFSPWPLLLTALALVGLIAYNGWLTQGRWVLALLPGREFAPPGIPTLPRNPKGYDGQFGLYMALYPGDAAGPYLDVPAYRYQRVLLPALARLLGGTRAETYPWAAWAVLAVGHLLGVAVVQRWLRAWGRDQLWAVLYGLWPGFMLAFRAGLPEPLSYGLALAGVDAGLRGRSARMAALLLAAVLAKETALLVVAALALAWLGSRPRRVLALALGVVGPWLLWQAVLWALFGRVGVGSGGAGATGWSWVPLGWLAALAARAPKVLGLYLLVFGPSLLAPVVVGVVRFGREVWACRGRWARGCPDVWAWLLGMHTGVALFLPFSTWREPFAATRVLSGSLVAFWLYHWQRGQLRGWRVFVFFWMVLWVLALGRV